jgi:hypothetical protein
MPNPLLYKKDNVFMSFIAGMQGWFNLSKLNTAD